MKKRTFKASADVEALLVENKALRDKVAELEHDVEMYKENEISYERELRGMCRREDR